MKELVLNAQKRSKEEKLSEIRAAKMVPWVVYGKNKESISLKIDNSDLIKTYRLAGESHIITLDVENEKIEVLVHDSQKDPVTWDFLHIDFYAVTRWEKLSTKVALHFVWDSQAAKDGALIEEHIKEIEIKTLPKDLVDFFEVNLSKLEKAGDIIRISDLGIDSDKYEIMNNADDVVVIASEPKVKEETVTDENTEEESK